MDNQYTGMAKIFKALSDQKRVKIIDLLSCGELCACVLLKCFEITQPTLSHDMKLLMDAAPDYELRTTVVDELHEAADFEAIGAWIRGAKHYFLQAFTIAECKYVNIADTVRNGNAGQISPIIVEGYILYF